MYNITLEFIDHDEQIRGLTRKQAARIVEAHSDAEDIWVSINDQPGFSIYDFPMAIW
jgi:hypothetical protein